MRPAHLSLRRFASTISGLGCSGNCSVGSFSELSSPSESEARAAGGGSGLTRFRAIAARGDTSRCTLGWAGGTYKTKCMQSGTSAAGYGARDSVKDSIA